MSDLTSPKPFVFVLMPFSKEFNDIYKLGIKGACQDAGAYCERVDEQIFTDSILDRIYNQITKCDLIVSDMSGRNPNVFYETGYAHALGKQVILLTQYADDIPFDMKHFPHIIYERDNVSQLKNELEKRVKWLTENPQKNVVDLDFHPEYYLENLKITEGKIIKLKPFAIKFLDIAIVDISLLINNTLSKSFDLSNMQLGLLGPWSTGTELDLVEASIAADKELQAYSNFLSLSPKGNLAKLPDNTSMYLFTLPNKILPESWTNLNCRLALSDASNLLGKNIDCTIRLFTEIGSKNIDFKIKIADLIRVPVEKKAEIK